MHEQGAVYFLGGVNIDFSDIDSVSYEECVNCFRAYGLTSLAKLPTGVTLATSATIDHILTYCEEFVTIGVILFDITDYYPVFLSCPRCNYSPKRKVIKTVFGEQMYVDCICGKDWRSVFDEQCSNKSYNNFISVISNAISCSSKTVTSPLKYFVPATIGSPMLY